MTSVTFKTVSGDSVTIEEEEWKAFTDSLMGEVVLPADGEAYAAATRIWNAMFTPNSDSAFKKTPAAVVLPAGPADCSKIMKLVHQHSLKISVKGGGHNVAGGALVDGGLVISLTNMNATVVDPVAMTATTQGGTIWREFYQECYAYGLGTTGGVVGDTGVAGLALGGGVGYLRTKHGMVIDNIVSMQVVLSDGTLTTVDKDHNADLFYAMRGGGGGFALVTSFTLKVYPIPETHWVIMMAFDKELYPKLMATVQKFIDEKTDLHEVLGLMPVLWPNCQIPHPDLQFKDTAFLAGGVCVDPGQDPAPIFASFKEWFLGEMGLEADKVMDLSHPETFVQWNAGFDFMFPMYVDHAYWKGHYVPRLSVDLAQDILEVMKDRPEALDKPLVGCWTTYGKMLTPDDPNVAFGKRHPGAFVSMDATWTTGAEKDEEVIAYARKVAAVIEKYASGSYLQWAGSEEERAAAAKGQVDDLEKLVAIKKKHDPKGLFPSWV